MKLFEAECRKLFILILTISVFSGCSTIRPYKSGRAGLLDRNRSVSLYREVKQESSIAAREAEGPALTRADLSGLRFQWPLDKISVTSEYGKRGSDFHEGIDFRAAIGTPIHAVEAGTVIYADKRVSGYGKMVVLRHANGFATIYAHGSKLLVRRGQKVRKGQKIALSGNTGRSSGPHLHFEMRKGITPLDPGRVIQLGAAYAAADKQVKPVEPVKTMKPKPRLVKRDSHRITRRDGKRTIRRDRHSAKRLASARSHSTRIR